MQPRLTGYAIDSGGRTQALNQQRRIAALGQVELFKGMSKRSLIRIDQIATMRTARKGDVVMTAGDPGNEMIVVLEGRASVTRGRRKLGECSPGQCVGEMALLDNQPRSATVVAIEPMRMLVIPGSAFRKVLSKVPSLTEALLSTLSARLREANAAGDF